MAKPIPQADLIWQNSWSFARTAVLAAAVELKLFDAFAAGPAGAGELARRLHCSPRGVEALADALVGMQILTRDDAGRFDVTELTRCYLGPDPQVDLGPQVLHTKQLGQRWWRLAESVRTGEPLPRDPAGPQVNFTVLVRQLFNGNYAAAQELQRTLVEREKFVPASVLDIGAGAAPWSMPFAQANGQCRVTVVDYPEVLPVTKEYAARFGVGDRYSYRGEPAEAADLGKAAFDLILVGHLYHSMGAAASEGLASRCAAALKPGGLLAVCEFVVDDGRRGPLIPLLFACNMLLGTPTGTSYTASQIDGWSRAAGLTPIAPVPIPTGSPVRLARKG